MNPTHNISLVNKIGDEILKLLVSVFDSFGTDERESVKTCLTNGYTFLLYALNAFGNKRTLIGAVLLSADEDKIWINWLGIDAGSFDWQKFGKKAFMESFCKSGFGTLILLLTQIRSAINSWSTDIYLQANQQAAAINFYKSVGFKRIEENSQSYLPMNWQFQINVNVIPTFYIKFIDNETIKKGKEKSGYV